MENPPPAPIPVIPIKPRSRIGWVILLIVIVFALAGCIFFMLHPTIGEQESGGATVYQLDREQLNHQILLLIVAGVCSLALVVHAQPRTRFRKYGGAGLILAVVLPLVTWHQSAARIAITPDSFTAPREGRLFPGDPITIRFDALAMLQFSGNRGGKAGRWQRCYTKDRQEIKLDFGPLGDAVADRIAELAEAHGVKVYLP